MLKNYLKVAFRSLNKNRVYAVINILGLALGLMVTILVFMFVMDETSYDKHWNDYNQIYRPGLKVNMMGQKIDGPVSPSPMAQALTTEFTDVETATRIRVKLDESLMRSGQTKIYIKNSVYADSAFFKVFDYEFIHGNPLTALKNENAIVLNEETARKLFGDKNAMGEIVNFDNKRDYIVKGIVRESKGHSHFQFNMFLADNEIRNFWLSNNNVTYLKLRKGVNFDSFVEKMKSNFMKKIAPDVEKYLKIPMEDFLKQEDAPDW